MKICSLKNPFKSRLDVGTGKLAGGNTEPQIGTSRTTAVVSAVPSCIKMFKVNKLLPFTVEIYF